MPAYGPYEEYHPTASFLSEEDLKERKNYIGGSEVAAILGLSPWNTPLDVWRKKTEDFEYSEPAEHMAWGNILEPTIVNEFLRRNVELKVIHDVPEQTDISSIIKVRPDKVVQNVESHEKIPTFYPVEIKTTNAFQRNWTENIPDYYYVQVLLEIAAWRAPHGYTAVLIGGQKYKDYVIESSPKIAQQIIDRCHTWWDKYVVANKPPPAQNLGDIAWLYGRDDGETIEATADVLQLIENYKSAKSVVALQTKVMKSAELELKKYMENHAILINDNKVLCTWKSPKDSTVIDYKALAQELIDGEIIEKSDLEPFTFTKENARRFLVK